MASCSTKPQLPAHLAKAPSSLPPNTHPLPRTGQLAALLTGLRNKETSRGAFVFYADRVNRLLVEEGESSSVSSSTRRRPRNAPSSPLGSSASPLPLSQASTTSPSSRRVRLACARPRAHARPLTSTFPPPPLFPLTARSCHHPDRRVLASLPPAPVQVQPLSPVQIRRAQASTTMASASRARSAA